MPISLLDTESLARTLIAVEDARFFDRTVRRDDRRETAAFIVSRQGAPGAYQGLFAPTPGDFLGGEELFTGEKLKTRAGTAHTLGEEAMRALRWLAPQDHAALGAIKRASRFLDRIFESAKDPRFRWGEYCCGTCSVALLRNLATWPGDPLPHWKEAAVERIREMRDGLGRWRRYPFYYTLLALLEMDLPGVDDELRYAWPGAERALTRLEGQEDPVSLRRKTLLERIGNRIG